MLHQPAPWWNAKKLDYSVRQAIVKLHKEKRTIREISEKVKRSKSVVGQVIKSYNDTGKIVSAFKTGRPQNFGKRRSNNAAYVIKGPF